MLTRIANQHLTVEVSSLGAEMQSLRSSDGRDWLWSGDAAFWTGRSPILFPIVGKAPGNRLTIDGKVEVEQKGGLGSVDPVRPLAWMIDHAVRRRGGLRAGQAITTGSWTGLRYYPPGTRARGEFVGLGTVEASF